MKLENIHSECQHCANLKAWNIHMNGEHDYACRKYPSGLVSKDLHWEPCEKFEKELNSTYDQRQIDDVDLQEKDLHQVNNKDVLLINIKTSINDFITELQENAKHHADFIKDNVDMIVFGAEAALEIVEETIHRLS